MPELPKHLRAELNGPLRERLRSIGFASTKSASVDYLRADGVDLPLTAVLHFDIEPYKYGGLRVGFYLDIRSTDIDSRLASTPEQILPPRILRSYARGLRRVELARAYFGLLADQSTNEKVIIFTERTSVPDVVDELIHVIDGPGRIWLEDRVTPERLLGAAITGAVPVTDLNIRSLLILAYEQHLNAAAGELAARYQPVAGDTPEAYQSFLRYIQDEYGHPAVEEIDS